MTEGNAWRGDFPFFSHNPDVVYLDTGAMALKPRPVIDAVRAYYEQYGVNINRGLYDASWQMTEKYEEARKAIARFINAQSDEIVFTSGTTHGLNELAAILSKELHTGDNIVLTRMEHHANLIPWQEAARRAGCELRFIEMLADYTLDLASADKVIDEHTKIVSFTAVSNVLGTTLPAEALIERAKKVGAYSIIDAAQGIVHAKTDVKKLDCDFLVFSGHKLYGPTGIGVLYGKKEHLEKLDPFFFGGDMIRFVEYERAEWAGVPHKFEAGTPNIAGVLGLGAAVRYIEQIGWDAIIQQEEKITKYALEKLKIETKIKIIGPETLEGRSGVISFLIGDIHPHDTGDIFNRYGVAVRVGHHCAMPLVRHLGIVGTVRASFGMYNTKEDVDALVRAIEEVKKIFA